MRTVVRPLRMRTTLQASLLLVAVSMTIVFLILVRFTVQRQLNRDLAEDTQRSEVTFSNLQNQRRHLLERTAALMADLPSLKALMTARDPRTISDGGAEFWRVSGSSLFALNDQEGRIVSFYNDGTPLNVNEIQAAVAKTIVHPGTPQLLAARGRLLEVLSQPIEFGSGANGSSLGYVTVGYSLDREMAEEVGQAVSAHVAFIGADGVVASTVDPAANDVLTRFARSETKKEGADLWLGKQHFLARTIPLNASTANDGGPYLVVLKSYDQATRTLRQLNLWIILIGAFGLLVGGLLAAEIARTVTRPLESLLAGTRALSAGNFNYKWQESGALEVRGLSLSFRRMQAEIESTQRELLLAERMATIGRMASSISHDLRHYLTSMYANAEFLSMDSTGPAAREEMLDEVKTAVVGMTDLLDSLLVFGRTGMALQRRMVNLVEILDRAIGRVKTHPEARGIEIRVNAAGSYSAIADPQELDRAIYNLLLNACQAAKRSAGKPRIAAILTRDGTEPQIRIEDNGPGVPAAIRDTLFQPFVSEGKEHGTGLGLALSSRIMEAHGGSLRLEKSEAGHTVFCLNLPAQLVEDDVIPTKYLEGKI
ncbi:MAG: integral rane sensor signal transduction histidine kinase [Acidobacteriaceae bacterium]|nr:integral rane sensor signal transduction histidine kinase [Acidobacteriaceae bacterium]